MTESLQAIPLSTGHSWDDVRWSGNTRKALQQIQDLSSSAPFRKNPKVKGKQLSFRFLFSGDDTDRKWIAAAILGRESGKEVFRVALGMINSTFIGETEKNLQRIFSRADAQKTILFFDEADALFGKSDEKKESASDQYVAITRLIESYSGIIIFSCCSNTGSDALSPRRVHATVVF